MNKQKMITTLIAGLLLAGTGIAQAAPDGARINDYLDRKGDRIDHRLDRKGDRIDYRLDHKGDRIDRRLDRAADRAEAAGKGPPCQPSTARSTASTITSIAGRPYRSSPGPQR